MEEVLQIQIFLCSLITCQMGKIRFSFDTEDASGSTSQAANVVEAMETDSSLFLIDEDTSATNFMIRDELMQRVVLRDQEPITPFIERIRGVRKIWYFFDHRCWKLWILFPSGRSYHSDGSVYTKRYHYSRQRRSKRFPYGFTA